MPGLPAGPFRRDQTWLWKLSRSHSRSVASWPAAAPVTRRSKVYPTPKTSRLRLRFKLHPAPSSARGGRQARLGVAGVFDWLCCGAANQTSDVYVGPHSVTSMVEPGHWASQEEAELQGKPYVSPSSNRIVYPDTQSSETLRKGSGEMEVAAPNRRPISMASAGSSRSPAPQAMPTPAPRTEPLPSPEPHSG